MEEAVSDQPKRRLITRKRAVILAVVLVLIGSIGYYVYGKSSQDANPIPVEYRSQLPFSPFVIPVDSKKYTVDSYKFSTVENNVKIFSYVIHTPDGNNIALSEYTQPPEFEEIPEYKNRFLNNVAKQYATAQTANGTIYLGRQAKQNDRQLAVMLERGLLVLMSPDKKMDEAKWRALGDELEIRKVSD